MRDGEQMGLYQRKKCENIRLCPSKFIDGLSKNIVPISLKQNNQFQLNLQTVSYKYESEHHIQIFTISVIASGEKKCCVYCNPTDFL